MEWEPRSCLTDYLVVGQFEYCALSLHFMYYNFCRIHHTLRVTPAMMAGVTDHVWDIKDIVGLIT